ncbi:MAG: lipopolysaccharide biosynthesis protein [Candidatus Gastranaerophilales bacterium]|nr:lipopolysaccharide biosynthesis protein [Candidatus Gastranaerophilales bacterium]
MNGVAIDKVGDKTRQSLKWSFTLQALQKMVFFCSSIVLARLLTPADFGLATMAITLDSITWLVSSLGINTAVVHFQDHVEERLNSVYWLFQSSAAFFVLLQLIFAPLIADFYHSPILADIVRITAISIFINSIGAIHRTVMVKNLEFKKLSILEASLFITKSLLYIILAFAGCGVWSFIYPKIIIATSNVICLWNMSKWRPKLKLDIKYWGEMFGYGKNVLFSNILDYFLNNSSYIFIGSMVGAASLGIYSFAYDKSMMLVNTLVYSASMISFPAFSRLQNHQSLLKESYLKAIKLISLVSFPYSIAQMVLGPEYITVIFGQKWTNSIILFQMLLMYTMIRTVSQCGNPLLQAIGKPNIVLKWNMIYAPIFIIALFIGYKINGLYGIGFATTAIGIIGASCYLFIVSRVLNWQISDIYNVLKPSFISSVLMGISIYSIRSVMKNYAVSEAIILFTLAPSALLVYGLSIKIFFNGTYEFILSTFMKFLGKSGEAKDAFSS